MPALFSCPEDRHNEKSIRKKLSCPDLRSNRPPTEYRKRTPAGVLFHKKISQSIVLCERIRKPSVHEGLRTFIFKIAGSGNAYWHFGRPAIYCIQAKFWVFSQSTILCERKTPEFGRNYIVWVLWRRVAACCKGGFPSGRSIEGRGAKPTADGTVSARKWPKRPLGRWAIPAIGAKALRR